LVRAIASGQIKTLPWTLYWVVVPYNMCVVHRVWAKSVHHSRSLFVSCILEIVSQELKHGNKTKWTNKIQERETNQERFSVYGPTTPNMPYLIWIRKLSRIRPGEYMDGRQIFRRDYSETSSLETKGGVPSKFKWSHW
jgi:hypothetical protein